MCISFNHVHPDWRLLDNTSTATCNVLMVLLMLVIGVLCGARHIVITCASAQLCGADASSYGRALRTVSLSGTHSVMCLADVQCYPCSTPCRLHTAQNRLEHVCTHVYTQPYPSGHCRLRHPGPTMAVLHSYRLEAYCAMELCMVTELNRDTPRGRVARHPSCIHFAYHTHGSMGKAKSGGVRSLHHLPAP